MRKVVVILAYILSSALLAEGGAPRNPQIVVEFRKSHPCPLNGQKTGPCPGWVVDHMYPICAGGADIVENMQWQTRTMSLSKDRLERELCFCKHGVSVQP